MLDTHYSTRLKLGTALVVLVILTSNLRQLMSALSSFPASPQTDDISQYERRFIAAKRFLPRNQVVSYNGKFAKWPEQCVGVVLAQYSVAPTVLAVVNSDCAHVKDTDEVSSHRSRLILDDSYDPRNEPYLLRLFPDISFQADNNATSVTGSSCFPAGHIVLLEDFGNGVRLYARGDK